MSQLKANFNHKHDKSNDGMMIMNQTKTISVISMINQMIMNQTKWQFQS